MKLFFPIACCTVLLKTKIFLVLFNILNFSCALFNNKRAISVALNPERIIKVSGHCFASLIEEICLVKNHSSFIMSVVMSL